MSTSAPAIVVLGPSALATAARIRAAVPDATLHGPHGRLAADAGVVPYEDLGALLCELYRAGRPILALCATGIVIRLLAPLLADKRAEPPVIAVAEDGSCVVPLLGGHRGANRLARAVAAEFGGHAAITTAGDVRFDLALDDPPPGWTVRNPAAAKAVTSALLAGRPVALRAEADAHWLRAGGAPFAASGDLEVVVTARDEPGTPRRLVLHPRILALGVGCERDVAPGELVELIATTLATHGLAREAVALVASIELKADEPAVHELAAQLGVPARFFPAARLEAETPRLANPSPVVFAATGAHGVAEAAALAAAGPGGELIVAKTRSERATCAVARASAPLDPTRIGRPQGHLAIVGLGPGSAAWRTAEAEALLAAAEDWVGYRGYLDLLPAGGAQTRHAFALGEEERRARHALALAADGRRVALVSSGDAGIYGMAALVCELLACADDPAWHRIALTFSPGVSALQAAAAHAGAPLGHDFCAISLSDLLTPWSEIERRLEAAAVADFVTVLYNPASARRRDGLARALAIFRERRGQATPVVHARALGRAGETVEIHDLAGFDADCVDMLSLIIVGTNRTRLVPRPRGRPLVYTPRGYRVAEPRS